MGKLVFLRGTNVWLESFLDQGEAEQADAFFSPVPAGRSAIMGFSLYSLEVSLTRLEEAALPERFLGDAMASDGVSRVRLGREELRSVPGYREPHGLDFDDAYQYAAVRNFDLKLVRSDSVFNRTDVKRLEPQEALSMYEKDN